MKLSRSCLLGIQRSPKAGCRQGGEETNGLKVVKQVGRELLETCEVEAGW